ncbi:hypothetical protein QBC38DRAFT_462068 [Podospora fimiseda]|uniref:Uncharacterized protein n=1 Tax=Podospora fimiseda TaxID=252190 RepID=A0AAN6YLG0_9PEZI|nr:hypothetical protein QBC38DRAFT_462068 [Podospora fimiseda]
MFEGERSEPGGLGAGPHITLLSMHEGPEVLRPISVWDDRDAAERHAEARSRRPLVYNDARKMQIPRGDIYITTIDPRKLIDYGGIIFCPAKCTIYHPGYIYEPRRDGLLTNEHEWLVVDQIRESAVLSVRIFGPDLKLQADMNEKRKEVLQMLQTVDEVDLFSGRAKLNLPKASLYLKGIEKAYSQYGEFIGSATRLSCRIDGFTAGQLAQKYLDMLQDKGLKQLWAEFDSRCHAIKMDKHSKEE